MKKLIIMMAVAVVTACSQAGTVSWSAANVYDGTSKVTKGNYIGILCLYTADSGVSASDLASYLGSDSYTTAAKIAKLSSATLSGSLVGSNSIGGFMLSTANAVTTAAQTYSAYAIFLDVDAYSKIADDTRYMITSVTSVTVPASGNKVAAIGNQSTTTYGVDWSPFQSSQDPEPTPEPTSAMLLVLGGAMLALRRRRA